MFHQARITMRLCCFAAGVALLALAAHSAPGKGGGGKTESPATLEFDDAAGDAIQSDGLGAYDVRVDEEQADYTFTTKKGRSVLLDFSDCDHAADLSCEGPFGPETTSGTVEGASFHVPNAGWEAGVTDRAGIALYFQVSGTRWKLLLVADVTPYDDDDDGAIDRYVFEDDGATSVRLLEGIGQRRGPGGFTYLDHGRFFMPWGATVRIP